MKGRRSPRRRSCHEAGFAHELTFSCYRHYTFLAAERCCRWLAESIGAARGELQFDLWAFVFMPEHVHLIVYPRRQRCSVAAILKAIKEPVGRRTMKYLEEHAPDWLPRVTRRWGARTERLFWQSGGGYDRNIENPMTLMHMVEYVHLNHVRRGLVECAEDWPWSSAAWFEGDLVARSSRIEFHRNG